MSRGVNFLSDILRERDDASLGSDALLRSARGNRQYRAPDRICFRVGLGTLKSQYQRLNNGASMADSSMTGTFQINLPKDLLLEANRASKAKSEQLHVEGWRNSWLSRISEMLVGKD